MRVYRFHLPLTGNDGRDYSASVGQWLDKASELAGGYTYIGKVRGYWRDPKTQITYVDEMHAVEVAVEDGQDALRVVLVQAFRILFPDQLAVYSAEIGQAWIE